MITFSRGNATKTKSKQFSEFDSRTILILDVLSEGRERTSVTDQD